MKAGCWAGKNGTTCLVRVIGVGSMTVARVFTDAELPTVTGTLSGSMISVMVAAGLGLATTGESRLLRSLISGVRSRLRLERCRLLLDRRRKIPVSILIPPHIDASLDQRENLNIIPPITASDPSAIPA